MRTKSNWYHRSKSILRKSRYALQSLVIVVIVQFCLHCSVQAQHFGDKCVGTWEGTMHIYNNGSLTDSVPVRLSVSALSSSSWKWTTEYLSPTLPMVKDYILKLVDAKTGKYVTDEGNGIELSDYLFGNKLYCVFEVSGILLTSSYELIEDKLIFEVTSGKKELSKSDDIETYATSNLQRVVFRRLTKD